MSLTIRHTSAIVLVTLAIVAVYSNLSTAYFCGYDDFAETHRAAFEDTRNPQGMFVTAHFGTSKFRPLNRALIYATWHLGGGSAAAFRARNLAFHLAAAIMTYGIAWLLFGSQAIAVSASLLFGIHPLANQAVAGATWTNTAAYALLLTCLYLFLHSLRSRHGSLAWLAASMGFALLGLFTYEPTIAVFGFMYLYLIIWWINKRPLPRGYIYTLAGGTVISLLAFTIPRMLLVHQPVSPVSVRYFLGNLLMSGAALILPIDPVLANTVAGTPLPSELIFVPALQNWIWGAALVFVSLAAMLIARSAGLRRRLKSTEGQEWLFLAAAIIVALVPILSFTNHASETYLYLPAALYAILLSVVLKRLAGDRKFASGVLVFAMLFGAATWVRNGRVAACGATAGRILAGLPLAEWRQGDWRVRLASLPGEPSSRRYGLYGYSGLSTIDAQEPGMRAAEWALQIATGNDRVKAQVVDAMTVRDCGQSVECFLVAQDGTIRRAAPATE